MKDPARQRRAWIMFVGGSVFIVTFLVVLVFNRSAVPSLGWLISMAVLAAISVAAGLLGGTSWRDAAVTARDRKEIILWPAMPVVAALTSLVAEAPGWYHWSICIVAAVAVAIFGYSAHFLGRAISRRRSTTRQEETTNV